jgi:hypothetical protein
MSNSTSSDSIYKYIGLIAISLFVIFIIMRTINFQSKVLEGLTSDIKSDKIETVRDKIPDAINVNTTNLDDSLNVDKYTKTYEDIIINLENNINYYMLSILLNKAEEISNNPLNDVAQKTINTLNNMKTFKDTLNDSMGFLNSIASSNNKSSLTSKLNFGSRKKEVSSLLTSFDN